MVKDNPLLSDDPETTALRINNLLALAQLACASEIERIDGEDLTGADLMYGSELAIQIAREAVSWLGQVDYRREPTPDPANVSQLPAGD